MEASSTADGVKEFLRDKSINVVSCFGVKSWMREKHLHDKVTAFRVSVLAQDKEKVLNKDLWPQGILIRDWKFKKNQHGL